MAHIRITSDNPELSFVLFKNPATQLDSGKPFSKSLRKGEVFGWYAPDGRTFSMLFKDSPAECSFATGRAAEFEYLDQTRYASPYAPVAMLDTLLRNTVRERQPADLEGYLNTVEITSVRIAQRSVMLAMQRHFTAFELDITPLAGRLVNLKVSARRPLHEVLNLVMVFCLLQAIADPEIYVELSRDALMKYVRALNTVSAPYFVRYMFVRDAVGSFEDFRAILPALQVEGMVLNHGDTRKHRFNAIKPSLLGGTVLVDIGCGEGFYVRGLAPKYETVIAYEQSDELRERTRARVESKGVKNVEWRGMFGPGEALPEGAHVLMTEVLEHMPLEVSAEALRWLATQPVAKMVFTVPNREFNVHYGLLEEDMRHNDHDWEPTLAEFEAFMRENLPGWELVFTGIGDAVAGVSSSLMCEARPLGAQS